MLRRLPSLYAAQGVESIDQINRLAKKKCEGFYKLNINSIVKEVSKVLPPCGIVPRTIEEMSRQ